MCMDKFIKTLLKYDPTPLSIQQIHDKTGITKSTLSRNKSSLMKRKPPEIIMIIEQKKASLGTPTPRGRRTVPLYGINHEHPWYRANIGGKE